MKKSMMMIMLLAVVLGGQPKPNPLKGVWRYTQYSGPDSIGHPAQPGIVIFTEKHYSMVQIAGDHPRQKGDPSKPFTQADLEAMMHPLTANSGTYEISGMTVTMRPVVAKMPNNMGGAFKVNLTYKLDGDTLVLARGSDGPRPGRGYKYTYTRVE